MAPHHTEECKGVESSECEASYESCSAIAKFLLDKVKLQPVLGIICGSGLGGLADHLQDKQIVTYQEIPGFPQSRVEGHKGQLVFGKVEGVPTVCMQGRFHYYEGYPLSKVTLPVRVFKLLGIKVIIVTNACGGLNQDYKVGDVMLIKDHINLPGFAGNNPLRGLNDERWGPRFPAMNTAYELNLRQLAKQVASELKMEDFLREGVYAMYGGPNYETVTECRAIRGMGADAVGMSTVPEVIVARHCGLRVLGISLITNIAIMEYDSPKQASHQEVLEAAERRKPDLEKLVTTIVKRIQV